MRLEEMHGAWLDATDPAGQRRIAAEIRRQAFVDVPCIPLGRTSCAPPTGET